MDKKNTAKIAGAAFLFMMVASVIHGISLNLTMQYYTDPAYASLWSAFVQNTGSFTAFSLFINFIIGALFAQGFLLIKGSMSGGNYLKKGANYGLLLFLIATLPFVLMAFLLLNVPLIILFFWAVFDGFVLDLVAGIIIAKIVA